MPEPNPSQAIGLGAVKELLEAFNATDVSELTLEHGDFRLSLKKAAAATVVYQAAPVLAAAPAPVAILATRAATAAEAAPAAAPAAPAAASKLATVNSPMVGTFYRSPSQEAPPFVDSGDVIKPGSTVCIVEAMKLMNEIEAEVSGKVVRFLVENGQPVEYGQPLLEIEPA